MNKEREEEIKRMMMEAEDEEARTKESQQILSEEEDMRGQLKIANWNSSFDVLGELVDSGT